MQLQRWCVSLEGFHFDNTGFFKEVKAEEIVLDLVTILNLPRHTLYYVCRVISFRDYLLNWGHSKRKLTFENTAQYVLD